MASENLEIIEKTFPVTLPARLRLSNVRGTVNIQPGNNEAVEVVAAKHLEDGNPDRTVIEMNQEADGRVRIETHFLEGMWHIFKLFEPARVDYTVKIPRSCQLKVECVSSSATIQALEGEIELSTVSGELNGQDLAGTLRLSTVSGDVGVEKLTGELRLNTVSGDIRLVLSEVAKIDASTVSGDINIETPLKGGPYAFDSVSGDIRLQVPPETACTVEFKTVSGSLDIRLPVTAKQRSGGRSTTQVNGGGSRVHLSSVSGNLRLFSAAGTIETSPASNGLTPEQRREILEKIERGEISTEDAIQALKGS